MFRQRHIGYFTALLLLLSNLAFSQSRLSIEVSGGFAFPVGSYSEKNASDAAVAHPDQGNDWIIGYTKSKAGFAKPGYYLQFNTNYRISKLFSANVIIGKSGNPTDASYLSEYVTENGQPSNYTGHSDYRFTYLLPGFGIQKNLGNKLAKLSINMGPSTCNYPSFTTHFQNDITWETINGTRNISGLMYRVAFTLNQKISERLAIGLNFNYATASLDYTQQTSYTPGFTPNPSFEDTLKMRTINFGATFSYAF